MASTTASGDGHAHKPAAGVSVADLPKTWHFTSSLPADSQYPTPADSHETPRNQIRPRQVRNAIFSYVRPEPAENPELLAVSPAAMRDIGIREGDETTDEFRQTVAGNRLHGWDEEKLEGGYPWAQCYGGFQFGQWAGQLGDGRAISLFETKNPATGVQYELQLKGAGMTPYSRFADGKAVLRSSIREFIVSEALHALRIPTTRALSLTLLRNSKVRRETVEPGAIVLRFAQSWLRFGNFDILRARSERPLLRTLATYVATDVLGGWEALPARLANPDDPKASPADPGRGVPSTEIQGPEDAAENRFTRLYREITRRNALTVAKWQAYGFMNGVLNTDNTSILGLSLDFGPFAFLDDFDPQYTPNHDDHALRYSYRNQPTIIWWNLVRLGEALGELLGAGPAVDDPTFIEHGVEEADADVLAVFLAEYKRLMTARLGLRTFVDADFDDLFSGLLDTMDDLDLDFHHVFRRLSATPVADLETAAQRVDVAARFFHSEGATGGAPEDAARRRVAAWLDKWRARVVEDWSGEPGDWDAARIRAMKAVNPNFVPRNWVLDEIIRRVEKDGERDVLRRAMHMALHPFEDAWDGQTVEGKVYEGDKEEEARS
ncbi:Protein adenylyltransferase SelO like protein [Verticillium longisporum]|uniref:Selenoprotein O n=1 Tax=Verticillium longisporum TaxID=100787 RepID=A0A8I2Z8V9_VERLO|nr:Protein adenylyltransferase SelO like protein [Verticillium longisporum]